MAVTSTAMTTKRSKSEKSLSSAVDDGAPLATRSLKREP